MPKIALMIHQIARTNFLWTLKMKLLLVLVLLISIQVQAESIQKWTDADGKVHYGDRPPSEVQAKQLKIANTDGIGGAVASSSAGFYGIPVYAEQYKVEKTSTSTNATMRFMTKSPVSTVVSFYKSSITAKYKIDDSGGSTTFSFKVGEFNKMVQIQNFAGKADVTLLSEK